MDISIYNLVAIGFLGVFAGWLNVMAGGGSLLTVPAMIFMDIPASVANGTNRIGILFQNISAVYGFYKKRFRDFRLSLSLSFFACIGAVGGASVGVRIDGVIFNLLLIFVMIGVMIFTFSNKQQTKTNTEYKPQRLFLGHILMIFAGFWGGLIQIGSGFILMPILNKVMHLGLVHTNMHKVFIVLAWTIVSLGIFSTNVGVMWDVGLSLAVGTSIGGYLGAHISITKGEIWIKRVLYVVLCIFVFKLSLPLFS